MIQEEHADIYKVSMLLSRLLVKVTKRHYIPVIEENLLFSFLGSLIIA